MVIDWQLYSDKNLVINKESITVTKKENEITYIDEYGTHIINLNKKIYKRSNSGEELTIDFNKSTIKFIFEDQELNYDLTAKFEDDGKTIRLLYSFGEEEKEIRITRKEEI